MAISIKNAHVEELARELSSRANETLTDAILHALEERLLRVKGKRQGVDMLGEIMAISHRCAGLPDVDQRSAEEILGYDKTGAFDGH